MAMLEELEKRVTALEQQVAALREREERRLIEETAAERGARMLREAKASQAAISAAVAKAFAEMGITAQPIGAEKLQQMLLAEGVKPEDNILSRAIIEMREE
ncbi:MAG TPA: hypothetical protein VKI65_13130 [Gemmataceae bacterium]|nr:hypothetical protein [Gemmataceae bacterium]